ncbi:MAG TPA: hypothetical protein VFR23_04615 [Jiangellaceae bacterium]|nr:hypothetical protein [Jiangellaceae bacterium]
MTPERGDELVRLASELVCRVRDVDPRRNEAWLMTLTNQDRWDLLFVLAAMVDPSVPLPVLLGWTFPLAEAADRVAAERFGPPERRLPGTKRARGGEAA